jgi:hypothetical protein
MTGELAWIMDSKESAVVVPSQAIQNGAVYVVENHRLTKRTVEIGLKGVERVEIKSGVKPGERIAISNVSTMRDGQPVRTSYTDPTSAAGLNKKVAKEDGFKGFNR